MSRRYRKSDVQTHNDGGYSGPEYPAVNVKVYNCGFDNDDIANHFKCDERTAAQAGQFAWDSACQLFWEQAPDTAVEILGAGVEVYSAGRSGGWLVVEGLADLESWDAVMVAKWGRFERAIKAEVKYRMSWDVIREDIEANRWAKVGAEMYNFIDTRNGEAKCIVDLKQQAVEAGFEPVIR